MRKKEGVGEDALDNMTFKRWDNYLLYKNPYLKIFRTYVQFQIQEYLLPMKQQKQHFLPN